MSFLLKLTLFAIALSLPPLGYVYYNSTLSPDNWVYEGDGQWKDGGVHGAPGPLMGAGLPVVLVLGGGYWLVRRFRRKAP